MHKRYTSLVLSAHIVALLIFVSHVSLSMEIKDYVDKDFRWTEVDGIDA